MNIPEILTRKYPGAEWSLVGTEYQGLEWLDSSPKPTKEQLEMAWQDLQAAKEAEQEAKIASRNSALAKLAALGLTQDEIASL